MPNPVNQRLGRRRGPTARAYRKVALEKCEQINQEMSGIVLRYAPKQIGGGWLDWEATYAGDEPFEPIGLGLTEGEAVADLIAQTEDDGDVAE